MNASLVDLTAAAKQILRGEDEDDAKFPLKKIAISVFDRWLDRENLHLLDCQDDAERQDRNSRMLSLWLDVYDTFDVLCRTGTNDFVRCDDRLLYRSKCEYSEEKTGSEFQCILIPELSAIYHENWDDTNVLWYNDRSQIAPILEMAKNCGLHSIEFDR